MKEQLIIKSHNKNLISIKCLDGEVDISSKEIDYLFNDITSISESVLFYGLRPFYDSKLITTLLSNYSESATEIYIEQQTFLYKLFISSLISSRNRIKTIWEHFEYPFLFFLTKDVEYKLFLNLKKQDFSLPETLNSVEGLIVVYKSFEPDVLWISKSNDVDFSLFENK